MAMESCLQITQNATIVVRDTAPTFFPSLAHRALAK